MGIRPLRDGPERAAVVPQGLPRRRYHIGRIESVPWQQKQEATARSKFVSVWLGQEAESEGQEHGSTHEVQRVRVDRTLRPRVSSRRNFQLSPFECTLVSSIRVLIGTSGFPAAGFSGGTHRIPTRTCPGTSSCSCPTIRMAATTTTARISWCCEPGHGLGDPRGGSWRPRRKCRSPSAPRQRSSERELRAQC